MRIPRLKAELRGPRAVWVVTGEGVERALRPEAYRLLDARGQEIPLARVLPYTARETLVVPRVALDLRRVYYVHLLPEGLTALCRYDGWFRHLYADQELGANVAEDGTLTTFRVFAPRPDLVRLHLYREADDPASAAFDVVDMGRTEAGVWEAALPGDLHGVYYDFTVHGPPDPGNFFYEQYPVHASDPYARVNVDAQGKSRVWRRTRPAAPLRGGRPPMEDVIAYEVHVQDFTDLLPVDDNLKGTLPAMTVPGLRNSLGEPIGFDYLVALGINVVHLLPVQEYLHYPDAEWRAVFEDDLFMVEQGVNLENYQWGYRTTHAFAVETRYRRRGTEHGAQRDQFRDLVQAFHDRDIAVVIDIVPNHTGENIDGRHHLFNFNVFDKPYYYRTNEELEQIGGLGNELKFEERPMVQRWLIDQCRHFLDEFGIDGFRIDLAGMVDRQSLAALRAALEDDVILYGEPWIAPADPEVASHPDWSWYKANAPITFFQDDVRNAFKGPTGDPKHKKTDRGYAGGHAALRQEAMRALLNAYPDEQHPNRGINYLDIHDNWALADQFATANWDGRYGVDEGPFKIAAGLLFTALGPLVLHGGTEMMRSKGVAPLTGSVRQTPYGALFFHGRRDTYNLRRANQFVWENVGRTREDEGSYNDYRNMTAYWRGLIALRRSEVGKVFRVGEAPPEGYYHWLLPHDEHLLGYLVASRVLVLLNTAEQEHVFEHVTLPAGVWMLVADDAAVDHVNGVQGTDAILEGGEAHALTLPPTSLKIWVRTASKPF